MFTFKYLKKSDVLSKTYGDRSSIMKENDAIIYSKCNDNCTDYLIIYQPHNDLTGFFYYYALGKNHKVMRTFDLDENDYVLLDGNRVIEISM